MCGIAGYIGKKTISKKIINNALISMENRGPDNKSYKKIKHKDINVYLLSTRLNIVDNNINSNMPFKDSENFIVFNGEIYNFKEIKKKIKTNSKKFFTNSDTEVFLRYYKEKKENCLIDLEGMWTSIIWDNDKKRLFVSRDVFGQKPLFYYKNEFGIFFASDIKTLIILSAKTFEYNNKKIKNFLYFGYKSIHYDNETFFKNIYAFPQSCYSFIDFNLKLIVKKYWKPKINNAYNNLSFKAAKNECKKILIDSIKQVSKSIKKKAIMLSGGIDSSIIAGVLKKDLKEKFETFSIIDFYKYNELKNISKTCKMLKLNNKRIYLDYKNFLKKLDITTSFHSEPISTISYFVQNFLSYRVSRNKIKIVLSGTGADELFAGYYDHFLAFFSINKIDKKKEISYWKKKIKPNIYNPNLKKINTYRFKKLNNLNRFDVPPNINKYLNFNIDKSNFFLKSNFNNYLKDRMFYELTKEIVPITLRHEDLNFMNYSIENRSPFLNKKLFEFAYSLPENFLIKNGYLKYILREAFSDYLHPFIKRDRKKVGFNASLKKYLDKENYNNIKDRILSNKSLEKFINIKNFLNLIDKKNYNSIYDKFIFNIFSLSSFFTVHDKKKI